MNIKENLVNVIETEFPNLPKFPLSRTKIEKAGYKVPEVLKAIENAIENAIVTADDYKIQKKNNKYIDEFLDEMKKVA